MPVGSSGDFEEELTERMEGEGSSSQLQYGFQTPGQPGTKKKGFQASDQPGTKKNGFQAPGQPGTKKLSDGFQAPGQAYDAKRLRTRRFETQI